MVIFSSKSTIASASGFLSSASADAAAHFDATRRNNKMEKRLEFACNKNADWTDSKIF